MRAVVVYESMYGNTHEIAERIAAGLRSKHEAVTVSVAQASSEVLDSADFLVVGGPTHAHGLSSRSSRRSAVEKDVDGRLDAGAAGPGLRDWLDHLDYGHMHAAVAFDTRIDGPVFVTGQASRAIAKRLAKHGYRVVLDPESFLVDRQNRLVAGEAERAEAWGVTLTDVMQATAHV